MSLPYTTEDLPFDESTLVFKVKGKMFALTGIETFESINLKCDPDKALELRADYMQVKAGYHMNKRHWNTIEMDGGIPDKTIKEWVFDSYKLVVDKLKVSDKKEVLAALDEA